MTNEDNKSLKIRLQPYNSNVFCIIIIKSIKPPTISTALNIPKLFSNRRVPRPTVVHLHHTEHLSQIWWPSLLTY